MLHVCKRAVTCSTTPRRRSERPSVRSPALLLEFPIVSSYDQGGAVSSDSSENSQGSSQELPLWLQADRRERAHDPASSASSLPSGFGLVETYSSSALLESSRSVSKVSYPCQ